MYRRASALFLFVLLVLVANHLLRARRGKPPRTTPMPAMQREPSLMLWAWETPEDFTALDPGKAGVAFLSREILLSHDLAVRPRYQPLHIAPSTWLIAVVRIETAPSFTPNPDVARRTALAIAEAAQLPGVRALQVDFDATLTQRIFYSDVLRNLRADLPAGFPVSITALVSWCGDYSWLRGLPIDEAVPMFFRMGGPAASRAAAPRSQSVLAEPLCSGSIGLATDEAWPSISPNQRVYIFQPSPWTKNDLARVNQFGYQGLRGLSSP